MIRDGEHFCSCDDLIAGACPTPPEYEFDWNYSVIVGFPCLAEATDFAAEVQGGNLAGYTTFSCSDVLDDIPTSGAIEVAQKVINLHRSVDGGMNNLTCATCETPWPCATVITVLQLVVGKEDDV